MPFGANRSYFNKSLRQKFINFQNALHINRGKIHIYNEDYSYFTNSPVADTIFYCDPPYLSSDSAYGRVYYLGKWDATKENRLYEYLDKINNNGGSFLLSNVIENNGRTNEVLKEWAKKYNIVEVPSDFTNCNYQRKNSGKTVEVLIRNYEC